MVSTLNFDFFYKNSSKIHINISNLAPLFIPLDNNLETIILCCRRQMVENLKKMQELKAQIQAQIKLAETLKKLSDNAGKVLMQIFH